MDFLFALFVVCYCLIPLGISQLRLVFFQQPMIKELFLHYKGLLQKKSGQERQFATIWLFPEKFCQPLVEWNMCCVLRIHFADRCSPIREGCGVGRDCPLE